MPYLSYVIRTSSFYRYLLHLATWMLLIGLYIFPVLQTNWNSTIVFRYMMVRYPLYGFINFHLFYILTFFILPLHGRQKHQSAITLAAGILFAFCLLKYALACLFPDEVLQRAFAMIGHAKRYDSFPQYFRFTFSTGMVVLAAAYGYYFFLQWRVRDKTGKQLETDTATALRQHTQMQHTSLMLLNKLSALEQILADEQKREHEGVEAILELSELLRYMLYDKNAHQERAPLERELYYFQLYLALHNRLHPQQFIDLEINQPSSAGFIPRLQLQLATEQLLQKQVARTNVPLQLRRHKHTLQLSCASTQLSIPVYETPA